MRRKIANIVLWVGWIILWAFIYLESPFIWTYILLYLALNILLRTDYGKVRRKGLRTYLRLKWETFSDWWYSFRMYHEEGLSLLAVIVVIGIVTIFFIAVIVTSSNAREESDKNLVPELYAQYAAENNPVAFLYECDNQTAYSLEECRALWEAHQEQPQ